MYQDLSLEQLNKIVTQATAQMPSDKEAAGIWAVWI